jgi:hypothetical protein
MSYHTWTTYGIGFCVDDIDTTPEKLLALAAMKPKVLEDVREYLNDIFDGEEYKDEDLTMEDFDELEGDYCERGVTYVLYRVIDEIRVVFADDYNGTQYILYCPHYPWNMNDNEKDLKYEDIVNIFAKYIRMLTDKPVEIDHQSVENGG